MLKISQSTPRPHTHPTLQSIRNALKTIAERIKQGGIPPVLGPFVIGLTGNGNVTQGCLDILAELPIQKVEVSELQSLIYVVHAMPKDYLVRLDGQPYERSDYYERPQSYRSTFCETVAPYLTLFLNGVGWSSGFPRLMSNEQLSVALAHASTFGGARFTNIGDISCDIEGGLQFLTRATTLSDPFYQISPPPAPGVKLPSVQMMELFPYVESLIRKYQTGEYDDYAKALERATIAEGGILSSQHAKLLPAVREFYKSGRVPASKSENRIIPTLEPATKVQRVIKKRVLMLGSGMVSGPAVEMISKRNDIQLIVAHYYSPAGNSLSELEKLSREYLNIQYRVIDMKDQKAIASLIAEADVVIRALNSDVLLLNEIGLDPGIDHCSAMDLIRTLKARGQDIRSFISFCGGLPAPDVEHTPLRYKFSWNPKGVLQAGLNGAVYKLIGNAHILRYPGFSSMMESFKSLGFLNQQEKIYLPDWYSFIRLCIAQQIDTKGDGKATTNAISTLIPEEKIPELHETLEWLGLLPVSYVQPKPLPLPPAEPMYPIDIFAFLLANRLAYQPHERDMVILSHELVTNNYQTNKTEVHTSSLIVYGTPKASAMARTVGVPVALAALAVVDGKIKLRGVQGPMRQSIYRPVLAGLEELGLGMTEKTRILSGPDMVGRVEAALVNVPKSPPLSETRDGANPLQSNVQL
ncbi:hypothetical protein C0991_008634 [Blastosporella zonata]|nr:hypothetical protein C0991_008634 [Blastosporella zonata]